MISLLHVDGNDNLLKAAGQYFQEQGTIATTSVNSAREAFDLLERQKFDAVISSYALLDMNGTEFIRSLRERGDTTPFIFFSETARGSVVIDALNLGADYFLLKGKKPQKEFGRLKDLIEQAVRKKQSGATPSADERTLDTLFDTSPDEIAITDLTGKLTRVSQKGLAIFGMKSPDEALGTSILDWILPEYHDEALRNVKSVFNGTHAVPHVYQLRRVDGTTFWGEINGAALRDGEGRPTGMIAIVRDISERKRAEEALNESEKRYRNLVESINDLVWEVDSKGVYTYVSPNIRNILGFEPGEIIGRTPFSLMPKGESERIAGIFLDCVRKKKNIEKLENRNVRKDGRIVILETSGTPVLDSEGNVTGYRGIDRDITERKWIDILLMESEEKFRALAETTSAAIVIYQNDRWVYANRAAEVISGYSKDEILSMNFWDIVLPEYRELVKNLGWARMREEVTTPRQMELRIIRKDGEVRWIDLTAGTITYRQKIAGILTVIDITGRKNAESELKKSEEKYRAIFNSFDDLYYQTDMKGVITNISPSCMKMTGFSPVDLIGMPVLDLYPFPEQRDELLKKLYENGSVQDYEIILRNKAGEHVNVSVNCHLVRDGLGHATGVEGTLRNITDRKRMEEELKQSEEKFRSLVENLNVGIYRNTADVNGKWLWANPEFLKIYGYESLGDLLSRPVAEIYINPEDRLNLLHELNTLGFVRNYQVQVKKMDGTPIWVSITAQTKKDERGKILWIDGIIRDITRQKETEEALQESEELFRTLFNNANDAIFLHELTPDGKPGRYIAVNETACKRLGYTREELLMMSPTDISSGKHRQKIPELIRRIKQDGHATFDAIHRRKDGTEFPVEVSTHTFELHGKLLALSVARDMVERMRMEEELAASEERLRAIINGSPIPLFVLNRNHEVIYWNWALEKYSGIAAQDIISTPFSWKALYKKERPVLADILIDDDIDRIPELYAGKWQKSMYVEGAFEVTDFYPLMGEHGAWLHVTAVTIRDRNGTILGAIETLQDITLRIRAEEELKNSEDYLKTIFNSVQTGLLIIDPATHIIIDANPAAEELIGIDKSGIVGKTCHHFICPSEDGRCPITDLGQTVDNEECILITAEGREIPILKMVIPIQIKGKQHLLESFSDISKRVEIENSLKKLNEELEEHVRKRTEALVNVNEQLHDEIVKRQQVMAALRKSEELYRGLVEHIMDVVFQINPQGTITYCSPSVLDLLGYTPEELIGRSSLDVIAPEDQGPVTEALTRGEPVTGLILTVVTKSGERRTVEINAGQFFLPDGTFAGFHGILRDITERKKMQEEIAASLQEKEIMLKEIHHRVKNNMQVISSLLSLQAKRVKDENVQEIMRESMTRVRSIALVHEKLYQSPNLSSIDYEEYINKMAGYLFQSYNVDPDLIRVTVDAKNILFTIEQAVPVSLILNELLSNALKYAFPQGRTGEIHINIHREGDNYIFIVADNGVGLPEDINLIKSKTLGLQLVDTLVKQIQGTLEVERSNGAVFRIRFPALEKGVL
ncbi:MAG: Bacterioopsin transcriptional activator [Methanoregula sp. PtaU1.Bin051]|nr:MAG: Bacterioopsin transcriptional activator [Methanoregula sp. PtaU1.Bin051]